MPLRSASVTWVFDASCTPIKEDQSFANSVGNADQSCGGEDRISVYQDPTFPDADDVAVTSDYLSLGCYTEGAAGRSLDYSQWDFLNASAMTTETCLTACGAKGFPFAGVEFGRECYCGVVLGNGTLATDVGECSSMCTGNSTQFCGGPNRLNLYVAKNLESTNPCKPPVLSPSPSPSPTPTATPTPSHTPSPSSSPTPTPSSPSPSPTPSKSTSICKGHHCPKTSCTTSSTKKSSSTTTSTKSSTTPCVGSHCKPTTSCNTSTTPKATPKTTTSCKTTTTHKPTSKTTSCKTTTSHTTTVHTLTRSSTLKTTTSCKTSTKTTHKPTYPTYKPTSTTHYGWGW
jgi:hypothetical protein